MDGTRASLSPPLVSLGGKAAYTSYQSGLSLSFMAPERSRPVTLQTRARVKAWLEEGHRETGLPAKDGRETRQARSGHPARVPSADEQTALHASLPRTMPRLLLPILSPSFFPSLSSCRRTFATTLALSGRDIRRRVTRLPSSTVVYAEEVEEGCRGGNDRHHLQLVNRNPRNLEQLSLEPKPFGFELETPSRSYWNA